MGIIRILLMSDTGVPVYLVPGNISEEAMNVLRAPFLRALAPATMNINASLVDYIYYANQ